VTTTSDTAVSVFWQSGFDAGQFGGVVWASAAPARASPATAEEAKRIRRVVAKVFS
jgi:hypothetical protein